MTSLGAILLNEEGIAQIGLPARVVALNREGFAVSGASGQSM